MKPTTLFLMVYSNRPHVHLCIQLDKRKSIAFCELANVRKVEITYVKTAIEVLLRTLQNDLNR